MKKSIPTLSINSDCNNNCPYCFQRNNKESIKRLSIKEVNEIASWIKQEFDSIIILGGEPLLHPNIIEIMTLLSKKFNRIKLITNLIADNEKMFDTLAKIPNIDWLINTTTNPKNKNIFNRNLDILLKNTNEKQFLSFSLVFSGNKTIDFNNIDNAIEVIKKLPIRHRCIRIMPNMPCCDDNSTYNMKNYDEEFNYFIDKIINNIGRIMLSFDCGINFCFISPHILQKIKSSCCFVNNYNYCGGPFIDISVDKKIYYCHYLKHSFFEPKPYNEYVTPTEYMKKAIHFKNNFKEEYKHFCKREFSNKNCIDTCKGFCPALTTKVLTENFIFNK